MSQENKNVTGNTTLEDNFFVQREKLETEVQRLALLDETDYQLTRKAASKELGISLSALDKLAKAERKKTNGKKSETALFTQVDAWDEQVNLAVLLYEIEDTFNKYVSFTSAHDAKAISLWVVHTYCLEAAYIAPILLIKSPEPRCGKSTVITVLQRTVFKCLSSSGLTPAALFRSMDEYHPTLICDEADTYMPENEGLRGVLNAGHSRDTSKILRVNSDTHEVESFDAFGAKCIAAIGRLSDTVEDRSIIIKMRRMPHGQRKEKMRLINVHLRQQFHNIQRKCVRFAADNIEQIKIINPTLPDSLNDRAADNWHPLLQIAILAGIEWTQHAVDAALALSGVEFDQENKSLGVQLLEEIQNIFDGRYKNSLDVTSADLIEALCLDDEAPWCSFNSKRTDGRITQRQLAFQLKPYGIFSKTLTRAEKRPKGYVKSAFDDAFSRYIHTLTPDFANSSSTCAPPRYEAGFKGKDENSLSATERIEPLPVTNAQAQSSVCSDSSGCEWIVTDSEKTLETTLHKNGADKIADLRGESVCQSNSVDI